MKSNRQTLIISIILLSCLVVGVSFAWWSITQKQEGNNIFTTACLSISFENETGTLSLDPAYPMTDKKGLTSEGYSFKIINKCDQSVSYQVNLDVFDVADVNNLNTDQIVVGIDKRVARLLSEYDDVDKNETNASYAKNIYTNVLEPYEDYTHTIKLWVEENVDNTGQNSKFKSRVFVNAGQNIKAVGETPEECFITDGSTIVKYKTGCGSNEVVIPKYINGTEITKFSYGAFWDANVILYYDWDEYVSKFIVLDEENFEHISSVIENIDPYALDIDVIETIKASDFTSWDIFTATDVQDILYYLNIPVYLSLDEILSMADYYLTEDFFDPYYSNTFGKEYFKEGVIYIDFSRLTNLKSIRNQVAYANLYLKGVEFPEGLETIGGMAFESSPIEKVFIPTTVSSIEARSFSNSKIQKIRFNSDIKLMDGAFSNNLISELTINGTLSSNDELSKAFSGNPNLTAENIKFGYYSLNTADQFLTQ